MLLHAAQAVVTILAGFMALILLYLCTRLVLKAYYVSRREYDIARDKHETQKVNRNG